MPKDYLISSHGRVQSVLKVIEKTKGSRQMKYTRRPKILKPAKSKDGYLKNAVSNLGKLNSFLVHRQVALAFIGNPKNKLEVNHINGIKTDNIVSNLEWVTRSENCQHSFDIGLQKPKRGELNGKSKLTESQVIEIRTAKKNNGMFWGRTKLAKKFNVSSKHIQEIANNPKLWESVSI